MNGCYLGINCMMSTILITGGTGLVGTALGQALLDKGYQLIILSRNPASQNQVPGIRYAAWDIHKQTIDSAAIAEADHIIHLAGASVAEKRWTNKRKAEILQSRVLSGELLVKSLREIPNKVKSVISASAIGWYGPDPVIPNPHPFTESSKAATDFLGSTCQQWEESTSAVRGLQKRLVSLRIGIVLSSKGGALKEFIKPLRFGVGAVLGNGQQVVSWIHIQDLVRIFISAIEQENIQGVYNAVAPTPVSNRDLVKWLARFRKKPFLLFRVPSFLLKWIMGEMSVEVLKSCTVSAEKLSAAGFEFRYPALENIDKLD